MITPTVLRIGLGLVAWAASLAAALSVAKWPGDWGHGLCGPWGCGPPLQPLLACHLAWLVILVPPAFAAVHSVRVPPHIVRHIGSVLCFAAAMFITAIIIWQRTTWWPSATGWQQGYFWQRCAFVLATTIDIPVAQVLLIGIYLAIGGRSRMLNG